MNLDSSFIILTVILAGLVLILAVALLRLSLDKGRARIEKSVSRVSDGSRSESHLALSGSRLLEHEKAPELLAELAEHFEKDFNLEFAEFTLGDDSIRGAQPGRSADSKLRRIELADGLTGSFRWKDCPGAVLSDEQIDELTLTARAFVANLNRMQEYKRQAIHDPLTGLFNAAYFRTRLDEEMNRAKRSGASLGLMIIDLDNFKQINDTHGHPAGDRILRHLAELLLENVRSSDIVARYGGDELCVILPDSDLEQTRSFMTRLHQQVSRLAADLESDRATVSIGAAVAPLQAEDSEALFKAADDTLLEAKRGGRNRALMYAKNGATLA